MQMDVFPNWRQHLVTQRRPCSGCIPTAYEMMLRSARASGINFASFQDDFDLDKNLIYNPDCTTSGHLQNNFESVAKAVSARHPNVVFLQKTGFASGADKVAFIEQRIANQQPTLVSLSLAVFNRGGWHIMPIVEANGNTWTLLNGVFPNGTPDLLPANKQAIAQVHDQHDGGKEVAWLESW